MSFPACLHAFGFAVRNTPAHLIPRVRFEQHAAEFAATLTARYSSACVSQRVPIRFRRVPLRCEGKVVEHWELLQLVTQLSDEPVAFQTIARRILYPAPLCECTHQPERPGWRFCRFHEVVDLVDWPCPLVPDDGRSCAVFGRYLSRVCLDPSLTSHRGFRAGEFIGLKRAREDKQH